MLSRNTHFATRGSTHDKFKESLNVTHSRIDAIDLDEDCVCGLDASIFHEWGKTPMAKHATWDNLNLLKRIRRDMPSFTPNIDGEIGSTKFDTLATFEFFEIMLRIFYQIFSSASGMMIPINNIFVFWWFSQVRWNCSNQPNCAYCDNDHTCSCWRISNEFQKSTWTKGTDELLA